ncbi:hypothetical protein Nepgr_008678 [Nepenthes gracilis]|uniref:Uncharacterized protein n=1 Tax=Nepenthes gracilis TaxID=150966 RepID=A0AAD3XJH2_NEPGR|nr:hypothetical protein Nepgr_008678 [Nepenthes gracilis]
MNCKTEDVPCVVEDYVMSNLMLSQIIGSTGAVSAGLDLGKGPLAHIGTEKYRLKWRWLRYLNNDRDRRDLITWFFFSGFCCFPGSGGRGTLCPRRSSNTPLWLWCSGLSLITAVLGIVGSLATEGNVAVHYHMMDIIPVTIMGLIGGVLGSLYNYLLHNVLRLYSLINERGKILKILLSLTVSVFTSACLYGLPFLVSCTQCDPSLPKSVCPTSGRTGNFKKFNCPDGYYNNLAILPYSLLIFFSVYCVLGLFTFGIAVPSGLFLPIILIGSANGRLLGTAMGSYTNIDQGLYTVLGAASLMAGSMRMTVSLYCFNPIIYEIILELKGLPFIEANPEPWMRNINVAELADAKPPLFTLCGAEKVAQTVEVLRHTTHNGFPAVDDNATQETGHITGAMELHRLILRTRLVAALKKKWFQQVLRTTEEWEVMLKFSWGELAEREAKFKSVAMSKDEMEMYVDLHPLTNKTPYTVVEDMSAAKAMVLFRQVTLRHLPIVPKYQASGVYPVVES